MVAGHVAIGAGASVSIQPVQPAVEKRQATAQHRCAGLAAAVRDPHGRVGSGRLLLGTPRREVGAGSDDEGGNEDDAAEDQEESSPTVNGSHHCMSPSQAFQRAQGFLRIAYNDGCVQCVQKAGACSMLYAVEASRQHP
jgi:hypothetical protein